MSHKHKKPVDINLTEPEANPAEPAKAPASPPEALPPEASPPDLAATDLPTPVPPTAEDRIAALETDKAELRDRMLRIAADFDNWKKRARKDQADGELRARESVLRDFLEIADNLERATASLGEGKEGDAKSIRDGVDLVLRQFRSKLERYQVKAIESVGQPFDPRFHEAISQAPTADAKPGSVLHELQKGYLIGDKLLRPAMVVVAAAPPPPPETSTPNTEAPGESASARTEGED
jgi:molecular chaperone GrpE